MKQLNLTIIGDPGSGKTTLLRHFVDFNTEEPMDNYPYPSCFKLNSKDHHINVCEIKDNLKHVSKTIQTILASDLIVYVMSLKESENGLFANNFAPKSKMALLEARRANMFDQKQKHSNFLNGKKFRPQKTPLQIAKSVMKSPYDSFLQALLQLVPLLELNSKIIVFVNKSENENPDQLQLSINRFKNGFDQLRDRSFLKADTIRLVFGSLQENTNISDIAEGLVQTPPLMETIYSGLTQVYSACEENFVQKHFPMRFSVSKAHKIMGAGTVVVGYQMIGEIKVGDSLLVLPTLKTTQVKSIENFRSDTKETIEGGFFGINLKGLNLSDVPKGAVLCRINQESFKCTSSLTLLARLNICWAPNSLRQNSIFTFVGYNSRVPCKILEIVTVLDFNTQKFAGESRMPFEGTQVLARLQLLKPAYFERHAECPLLGRFALVSSNVILACGKIENILSTNVDDAEKNNRIDL